MNQFLKRQLTVLKCRVTNQHMLKEFRISEKNQTIERDRLSELQWIKLKSILSYAFLNCPYYRQKYVNAGVKPTDIHTFKDFESIPVITKAEIREHIQEILPEGIDNNVLEEVYTGGTTGIPMRIFRDKRKRDLMFALFVRTLRFYGCDIGSKIAWLWGLHGEEEKRYDFAHQSRIQRFFRNVIWFNAFEMTNERILSFARLLSRFKPDIVIGYVSGLYGFAQVLRENDIKIKSPKAIWLTAEPSDISQRQLIEDVFGSKTYNQYGSSEISHIAAECSERSGLHIHADSRYVEILNSNNECLRPGEIGSIVVTDLENRAMPLIRYKNDDVGSLQKTNCTCGMSMPLMNSVAGRVYDMITLRNGTRIYGHMFSRILFRHVDQIRQFQVHQTSLDRIIVRVVPEKLENLSKFESVILSEFNRYTHNSIDFSFEVVNHIAREASGKLRYVKSDVSTSVDIS